MYFIVGGVCTLSVSNGASNFAVHRTNKGKEKKAFRYPSLAC